MSRSNKSDKVKAKDIRRGVLDQPAPVILHGTVEERVNQAVAFLELKERPNPPWA